LARTIFPSDTSWCSKSPPAGGHFSRQPLGNQVRDAYIFGGQTGGCLALQEDCRNSRYPKLDRSLYYLLHHFVHSSADQVDKDATATGLKDLSKMNPDLYNFHTLVWMPAMSNNSQTKALSLLSGLDHNPHSSQFCPLIKFKAAA